MDEDGVCCLFLFNTQLHSMIELVLLNACPIEGV
jgi:hypothetical protein